MKNISVCPICEDGNLEAKTRDNRVKYKGENKVLLMHFSECECCGSEQASPAELRSNKRLMNEFKKHVDGLLTGKELKEVRLTLSLTQADAANIFGGGPVAFSKYEADDVVQSEAMDKLLRVAQAVPEAYAYLTHKSSCIVEIEHRSRTTGWKRLVQGLAEHTKPKPRPLLKLISSKSFVHSTGYDQLQAVGT